MCEIGLSGCQYPLDECSGIVAVRLAEVRRGSFLARTTLLFLTGYPATWQACLALLENLSAEQGLVLHSQG
jgi:hypothetical protein